MALYLRCPNCGNHFIDYFGENAADDTEETYMNGPYLCPKCSSKADSVGIEEYYKEVGENG